MWGIIIRIGILVVSMVTSYVTANKAKSGNQQAPASFDDFDFPQFDEGTPIAYVFGDVWVEDWMVVGTGDFTPIQMISPF